MKTYSLHEARAGFSKLFDKALAGEPQRITRHGKEAVVLVSESEWQARAGSASTLGELLASYAIDRGFSKRDFHRPFSQRRRLGSAVR